MRFDALTMGVVALLAAAAGPAAPAHGDQGLPQGVPVRTQAQPNETQLNTLQDIGVAMRRCWVWPAVEDISTGMDLTVQLSFRRNGEIFGGRITYQSKNVSREERTLYYTALVDAIRRCSPLPVSASLGQAIAGRLFTFRFTDTRKQKKA